MTKDLFAVVYSGGIDDVIRKDLIRIPMFAFQTENTNCCIQRHWKFQPDIFVQSLNYKLGGLWSSGNTKCTSILYHTPRNKHLYSFVLKQCLQWLDGYTYWPQFLLLRKWKRRKCVYAWINTEKATHKLVDSRYIQREQIYILPCASSVHINYQIINSTITGIACTYKLLQV